MDETCNGITLQIESGNPWEKEKLIRTYYFSVLNCKYVLTVISLGAFSSIEEIPDNIVHDHEKNGLPRLSSFSDSEIQKR